MNTKKTYTLVIAVGAAIAANSARFSRDGFGILFLSWKNAHSERTVRRRP